ncbi:carboxylesterase family protein [Mycobacterium sp. C31M]
MVRRRAHRQIGASMHGHPQVRTEQGTVEGRLRRTNAAFRGISYAQRPVGALRFAGLYALSLLDGRRRFELVSAR